MKHIIGQDRTQIPLFASSIDLVVISADVGLMFTAMNLRRIINIVGFDNLKVYLRELIALLYSNAMNLRSIILAD